jgi:hypothetical protein
MGATRPIFDSQAVWLTIRASFGYDRGVLDGSFEELSEKIKKHRLRRGEEFSIDTEEGLVLGDNLSEEHLPRLFAQANQAIARDPSLASQMRHWASQLRSALDEKPGSYLVPLRPRSARTAQAIGTWIVLQFWPSGGPTDRITLHTGREVKFDLMSADHPDGQFA